MNSSFCKHAPQFSTVTRAVLLHALSTAITLNAKCFHTNLLVFPIKTVKLRVFKNLRLKCKNNSRTP
jgi:hypothetical protein